MNEIGIVYGYSRVSSHHQVDSGLSLDAQKERIATHMRSLILTRPQLRKGKIYVDPAVSATRQLFRRRNAGQQLDRKMKRGDHVVIAKLDRGFRSTRDCLSTLEAWQKRGVTVHLLDIAVDTSTPIGQLMIGILSAIAQWETQRLGERIRDALFARRNRNPNRAVTAVRIIGYAIDAHYNLTPHAEERQAGRIASELRSSGGQSCGAIAAELNRRRVSRPANPFGPRAQRLDRQWTADSVRLLIMRCRSGWPRHPGMIKSGS